MESSTEVIIDLSIAELANLTLSIEGDGDIPLSLDAPIYSIEYPDYEGETHFTPMTAEQVVHTSNTHVTGDILIDPIPSNYGLITWDGSTLTVS